MTTKPEPNFWKWDHTPEGDAEARRKLSEMGIDPKFIDIAVPLRPKRSLTMKFILAILVVVVLALAAMVLRLQEQRQSVAPKVAGSYEEYRYSVKPPELADCRTFQLKEEGSASLIITRCPNSSTTTSYRSGKFATENTVVSP